MLITRDSLGGPRAPETYTDEEMATLSGPDRDVFEQFNGAVADERTADTEFHDAEKLVGQLTRALDRGLNELAAAPPPTDFFEERKRAILAYHGTPVDPKEKTRQEKALAAKLRPLQEAVARIDKDLDAARLRFNAARLARDAARLRTANAYAAWTTRQPAPTDEEARRASFGKPTQPRPVDTGLTPLDIAVRAQNAAKRRDPKYLGPR